MPREPFFKRYSLRHQILARAGATFLICAGVVLLFLPIINAILRDYNAASSDYINREKEATSTNIARLIVLEITGLKNLLQVSAGPVTAAEQPIIDLLWGTVTFNPNIQRIELIQDQQDAEGKRLTFLFYRPPPGERPMLGPQKIAKKFSGPEEELIAGINRWQKVDQKLLGDINQGPKKEGEMALRYFPVYVLVPERGAVYWGVAKVGISTAWARLTLADVFQQQEVVRWAISRTVILSVIIAALLFAVMIYPWVGRLTEPLRNLAAVAREVNQGQPQEFPLWLENVRQLNPRGQPEVGGLQQVLLQFGTSILRLGQRLVSGESQACLGRVMGRNFRSLEDLSGRLKDLERRGADQGQLPPQVKQEMGELLSELQARVQDMLHLWPAGTPAWRRLDLVPALESAWRLMAPALPAGVRTNLDLKPVPPVWGSPAELPLAVLYLLDALADHLDPGSQLQLTAAPTAAGGVQIVIAATGLRPSGARWQEWLSFWQENGEIQEQLGPALAGAIVSQHGGTLTMDAKEKDGVVFSLLLPPPGAADDFQKPAS
jgi:signal transduction histidine kinase